MEQTLSPEFCTKIAWAMIGLYKVRGHMVTGPLGLLLCYLGTSLDEGRKERRVYGIDLHIRPPIFKRLACAVENRK